MWYFIVPSLISIFLWLARDKQYLGYRVVVEGAKSIFINTTPIKNALTNR